MSSKYDRKRKRELDEDTSSSSRKASERNETDERRQRHRSRSRSPSKKSPKKQSQRQRDNEEDNGGDKNEESLSIEETNKLRAKLGLAPLELEDKSNTEPVEKDDGSGDKVFTEHGVEIVHKPSRNWSDEKRQKELKEKLEGKKKQREVYGKVLKAKRGLAEEEDDDEDTAKWVEKNRRMAEEMRKASERAKQLDEMDEAFGIGGMIQAEQQRRQHRAAKPNEKALTGSLVVGHSIHDFTEGRETILVLQDKGILDDGEDGGEEVLINPNMLENERHKLNTERRKKTATHYQPYEEDGEQLDEFGQVKSREILAKYDEGIDGQAKKRETFKLDESGQYDLDKEVQEAENKRRLMMMNKKFESLGTTKYTLANEFYTEEEIIQFRRVKKGKAPKNMRKGGKKKAERALKADDLEPMEGDGAEKPEEMMARQAKLAARRAEREGGGAGGFRETMKAAKCDGEEGEMEEGELVDESGKSGTKAAAKKSKEQDGAIEQKAPVPAPGKEKWKKAQATVDVKMLESLANKIRKNEAEESDEEEEDELPHATNVAPIRIDDEAEEELSAMLAKARRLKQTEHRGSMGNGARTRELIRESSDEEMEMATMAGGGGSTAIVFDATSERYKSIGGGGYGKGGKKEEKEVKKEPEEEDEEDETEIDTEKFMKMVKEKTNKKERRKRTESENSSDFERMEQDRDGRNDDDESSEESEGGADLPTSTNILGEERDVTKGVAAMLRLAGEKGYLEGADRRRVGEGSLKHLESKRYSRVEQGRLDIEDKTMRKLERMGTTGTGPTRPFPEKPEYKPRIEINYADKSGRALEPKEAFRMLSWKFHGKGPGKKQAEKHSMKMVKREKMKKMNSQDTPLGTLNKQLKKQDQLQTPYLVLSGRGDAAPLQKE